MFVDPNISTNEASARNNISCMRETDGSCVPTSVTRNDGSTEHIYVSADKSRANVSCERDVKVLHEALRECYPTIPP